MKTNQCQVVFGDITLSKRFMAPTSGFLCQCNTQTTTGGVVQSMNEPGRQTTDRQTARQTLVLT